MPDVLERKLRKEAERRFPGDKERQDNWVAAAMIRAGYWKPGGGKGPKG